jgi:hypothetical protein
MDETLRALGRGIVKTLMSLFVGGGVGLLTFGTTTKDVPDLWEHNGPPGAFFTALGAGMLTTGAMMVLLFFLPRLSQIAPGKGAPYSELPH